MRAAGASLVAAGALSMTALGLGSCQVGATLHPSAPSTWLWEDTALLLMTGKAKHCGKNKRRIKPANHGARPCNHTARREKRPKRIRYKG